MQTDENTHFFLTPVNVTLTFIQTHTRARAQSERNLFVHFLFRYVVQATCNRKTIYVHCSNSLVRSDRHWYTRKNTTNNLPIENFNRDRDHVKSEESMGKQQQSNLDKNLVWLCVDLIVLLVLD